MSEKYDEINGGFKDRNPVPNEVLRKTAMELERADGVHAMDEKRSAGTGDSAYIDSLREEVEALKLGMPAKREENQERQP